MARNVALTSSKRGLLLLVAFVVVGLMLGHSRLVYANDVHEIEVEEKGEAKPSTSTAAPSSTSSSSSSSSTSSPPPPNPKLPTSTTDYAGLILKTKETNIKKIFELLRKMQAERCEYGNDPLLDDLCPDLMSVPSYSSIPHLKTLRLSDVRARVIDNNIVTNLIQTCSIGEWCLGDELLDMRNRPGLADNRTLAANSSLAFLHDPKLFCLIESCFDTIKMYADNCVDNDLNRYVVQLAPEFCNFDITNTQNEFCVENSLRLIHVSAAFLELSEEVKAPTPDVCHDEIIKGQCSTECKRIATSIDKLTSCCADTKLIHKFKAFDWYFTMHNQVRRLCDLPIKSICLSEGKYYLGISPKILVLSIVCSVLTTTLITMIVFLVCCQRRRRRSKTNKTYDMTHLYEYGHLNPAREEEEILIGSNGMNDEFEIHEGSRLGNPSLSNVLIDSNDDKILSYTDLNNNDNNNNQTRDISRFVNKHQTDIRGLFS